MLIKSQQPQSWDMVQVAGAPMSSPVEADSVGPAQAGLAESMLQANQPNLFMHKAREPFVLDYAFPNQEDITYNNPGKNIANGIVDGDTHIQDIFVDGKRHNPYTKKSGNKAFRNNNPGNITGMSGKLLYGASRIAHSKYGDKGDQAQLVYDTPQQGFQAMHSLMSSDRYNNTGISQAFAKWQTDQAAWSNMLHDLEVAGINTQSKFKQLSPAHQTLFMNKRARHEGWTGKDFSF